MKENKIIEFTGEISEKEMEMLNRVFERYSFQPVSYEKVRSVYKLKTATNYVCLKRFKHGRYKAENGNILVEELFKNNFFNTPKYIKTKNDNLLVKYKDLFFYATEWVDGEETNLDELEEAVSCAKLLAKFHLATKNINTKKLKIKNNLKNWPKIYKKQLYDFYKYEKIIDNKKIKSSFDISYKENINRFYNSALVSLKILNSSEYYRLSNIADKNTTICHDSFYYQNIIKKDGEYYIIDLDSIIIDLQINDLGKYIRRLMCKSSYRWNSESAIKIIEAYNSVNKLTKEELEVMLALIMFPHKFWKLGKKRYIKYKNWDERKYSRKLKNILRDSDLQEKFFKDYIDYMNNHIY